MKKTTTKKIALTGLYLALALIVSLIENLIPPIVPMLPYAKIGLGNVVLLLCFLTLGVWEGYVVLALRCLLMGVFSANMASLIWSVPSAFVAYTLMVLLVKSRIFSVAAVSVAGGMTHNLVQIIVAGFAVGNAVYAYLPYMLLAGGIAGLVTGVLCQLLSSALDKIFKKQKAECVYKREIAGVSDGAKPSAEDDILSDDDN